jgi:hypothetical protein
MIPGGMDHESKIWTQIYKICEWIVIQTARLYFRTQILLLAVVGREGDLCDVI